MLSTIGRWHRDFRRKLQMDSYAFRKPSCKVEPWQLILKIALGWSGFRPSSWAVPVVRDWWSIAKRSREKNDGLIGIVSIGESLCLDSAIPQPGF
jgi:hypothetical protein